MSRIWTSGAAMALPLLLTFLAAGCASTAEPRSRENSSAEIEAARLVLAQIKEGVSREYPTGAAQFDMGTLDEGCAVLLVEINGHPIGAAFWTHNGGVYYVNEAARSLNGSLPPAPNHITEKHIRAVAH